jgi:hypothetical protein
VWKVQDDQEGSRALTILAERQGSVRGSVADLFLPEWFADRIVPICGTAYGVALVLIVWRILR